MSKVPFRRRISDFFTQGHWETWLHHTGWEISFGGMFYIDSAPGYHFDKVGFILSFWTWNVGVFWVDNN